MKIKLMTIACILSLNVSVSVSVSVATDYNVIINADYKEGFLESAPSDVLEESPYEPGLLIETDYLVIGDKKSTLDTTTGLEWLDLTESRDISINAALLLYPEWRIPTKDEVITLLKSIMPNTVATGREDNNAAIGPFVNKIGNLASSYGWYLREVGVVSMAGIYYYGGESGYLFTSNGSQNMDYSQVGTNVWLVSDGGVTLTSIETPAINTPATQE